MGMGKTVPWRAMFLLALIALALTPLALAQEEASEVPDAGTVAANAMFTTNNVWMMVATFLVFIMHLGFATVESGLTRAKNTVNILFKNTAIPAIGLLTYAYVGFNLMYPGDFNYAAGILGFSGVGLSLPEGPSIEYASAHYTYWTDFLFQGMFAATAATIVSGAVAERVKLMPFLIFSAIFVAFGYTIAGSWTWGGGWLADKSFHDFAGSTLVHSVGGWGALAGAIILGPRIGKYGKDGKAKAIEGHNMPLATIGMFLLWLGWFGFNGGSVLSADPDAVSLVLVTTCLAASAGIMASMVTSWIVQKKPDLSMILNGSLAGLVGITAGADCVTPNSAVIIGAIAGVLVVLSVMAFDLVKIDDPVGALSVHLVCGIWGTLAVGIFTTNPDFTFAVQAVGVLAYGVFCFPLALIIFLALKFTIGIRVSPEEEVGGLDVGEHGMEAYGGFQIFSVK